MIGFSAKNKSSVLWWLILPSIAFFGIPVIDHYFLPSVIFTPTCNFIVIAILALRLNPWPTVFWAIAFLSSTLFVLLHPGFFISTPLDFYTNTYIRGFGWVTGTILAVILSFHRAGLMKDNDEMLHLLRHLPMPFVLSGKDGAVLFINEQALEMLNVTGGIARGTNFFSLVEDPTVKKGWAEGRYQNLFTSKNKEELVSKFRPCAHLDKMVIGRSILLENAGEQRVLTIFASSKDQ